MLLQQQQHAESKVVIMANPADHCRENPTVLMGVCDKSRAAESKARAPFLTVAEKALLQQQHAESKLISMSKHATMQGNPC